MSSANLKKRKASDEPNYPKLSVGEEVVRRREVQNKPKAVHQQEVRRLLDGYHIPSNIHQMPRNSNHNAVFRGYPMHMPLPLPPGMTQTGLLRGQGLLYPQNFNRKGIQAHAATAAMNDMTVAAAAKRQMMFNSEKAKQHKAATPSPAPAVPATIDPLHGRKPAANADLLNHSQNSSISQKLTKNKIERVKKSWCVTDFAMQGPVSMACRFVGDELQDGLWPSPFQFWKEDSTPTDLDTKRLHEEHTRIVAASLEEFATNVLLPALNANSDVMDVKVKNKIYLATLLCLREVIAQNAVRIFGNDFFRESIEAPATQTSLTKEEFMHCSRTMATALVIAAIERNRGDNCTDAVEDTVEDFLKVAHSYDNGEEEFSSCLDEDQGLVRGILPNGKYLDDEEEVARSVSFNQARKLHPLVQRDMERKMNIKCEQLIRVPEVNACHTTMVETLSNQGER